MKRKNSKTSATFARRRFLVEGLEPRCLLAGNVNVFVSGGTLFVQGDGADNAVLIQQEGTGEYSVTPLDFADLGLTGNGFAGGPTTINSDSETIQGEPLFFSGVTNDINVDLRGGNDALGIGNDVDTLNNLALDCFDIGFLPDDGGGSADVSISPNQVEGTLVVPRNLIVNLGAGNDFTTIDANVGSSNPNGSVKKGGVASINLGNGTNGAAFGHGSVADDLLIFGGTGNDNACVTDASIHDFLAVQLGDGDENDVDLGGFEAGHALVTTGKGNDQVRMEEFNLARELVVATGNGNDQVEIEGFDAQNVTVDTGAGNDGTGGERSGITSTLSIDSPVTVAFADISRTLVLVTGSGNDFATINHVDAHDIVFDTGSGDDGDENTPISIYDVFVQGNVTFVTGSGNDFAYMHSGDGQHSTINGILTINTGEGDDNLEVVDQSIGKDLNVFLGNGNNTAGIGGSVEDGQSGEAEGNLTVGRNLTLVGGANHDLIGLFNLSVHNDLFADLGAGNDELQSEDVTVGRNATLLLGSGDDHATINFANIAGNALIDAGSGGDTLSLNYSNIAKTATILMGSGNDTLNIFNSSAKKLFARGGAGTDNFNNDLGINSNGRTSDGKIDVQEFEFFND